RAGYSDVVQENELYERFYRESGIIPEEEWEEFWGSLKRTLPTTFRFTGSKNHALSVLSTLQSTHVPHLRGLIHEDQPVDPPSAIPWYPDNLAWGTTVGKSVIRRCPPFRKFQNFLVSETTIGNISRQEAVSMIPPLFMDIKPHHTVLDMCAAPGSKTAQLIEMLHMGEENAVEEAVKKAHEGKLDPDAPVSEEADYDRGRPTGLVIANDADYRRSHMLIHQTKRLNSPNLIVTNNDATAYPSLIKSVDTQPNGKQRNTYLKFDRVLADVPCSGDGTARKNYNVWKDWSPHSGLSLHLTQVRILVRGLQVLKVGGRLVYSTCSMNPIENEAVLASAILRCGGNKKVRIVDVSEHLPALKRRPGLKGNWKVMGREGKWWETYEDATAGEESGEGWQDRDNRLVKGMWYTPPTDEEERIPTERSMRIYPHLQDTGGFFVAVLEKLAEISPIEEEGPKTKKGSQPRAAAPQAAAGPTVIPADAEATAEGTSIDEAAPTVPVVVEATVTLPPPAEKVEQPPSPGKRSLESPPPVAAPTKRTKLDEPTVEGDVPAVETPAAAALKPIKKLNGQPSEEPFKYLDPSHPVLQDIFSFYKISPLFPQSQFMVRNAEATPTRAIYYTSPLAKSILEHNDSGKSGIRFVHCGVKMFVKQDVQSPEVCAWRIQNEGISIIEGWIGEERVVHARRRDTIRALLKELFPKWDADTRDGQDDGSGCAEIREQVRSIGMGCCVLRVQPDEMGFKERMVLPLWRSRHSINLMLPKEERKYVFFTLPYLILPEFTNVKFLLSG
ncbi:S-adenosyl-L-methionine-dependent methyltransferase, partial [Peziza echinospora]